MTHTLTVVTPSEVQSTSKREPRPFARTMQIATLANATDGVLAGLRCAPVSKLALICLKRDAKTAEKLSIGIADTLEIEVDIYDKITRENIFHDVMATVSTIAQKHFDKYEDFLLNLSEGNRMLCVAAALAASLVGFRFFVCEENQCVVIPSFKLPISEMLSEPKLRVLEALDRVGGEVESLDQLGDLTNYRKTLLSYHINGSGEAHGLTDLGLAETKRHTRGKIRIKLTTLGRMLLENGHLRRTRPRRA